MTALPFLPHEIDQHPDRDRFETTIAERYGSDADPDLMTRIDDLGDEVAELEDDVAGLEADIRALRDALASLLDAISTGTVTLADIDEARGALARTV